MSVENLRRRLLVTSIRHDTILSSLAPILIDAIRPALSLRFSSAMPWLPRNGLVLRVRILLVGHIRREYLLVE